MLKSEFEKTKSKFYEARENFTIVEKKLLKLKKPLWAYNRSSKDLAKVYKDQKVLYSQGRIALGTIVQANEELFKTDNAMSLPAVFLFSEDEYFLENPNKLIDMANKLYSLKGKETVDIEVKEFVDAITDEYTTILNKKLPFSISNGRDVYYTTIIVHRMHIPNIYLDRALYPLLVCPEKVDSSFILSSFYWSDGLENETLKY